MLNSSAQGCARERESERLTARVIIETSLALAGVALVVCAVLARQSWLDRHFLPSWFMPHRWYVTIESSVRAVLAATGLCLAFVVRARIARLITSHWDRIVLSALAALLALASSEMVLRRVHVHAAEWLAPNEEPRRRIDPRLGWTFVPSRIGRSTI